MNIGGQSKEVFEQDPYSITTAIIECIEAINDWDEAETSGQRHFYQLRAAHKVGVFEPFTAEQQALISYLDNRNAGRRLCDYAWRLYAQSTAPHASVTTDHKPLYN